MDATLLNILALYAGIVVVNVVLAGLQYWRNRSRLYRAVFLLWVGTAFAFFAQGAFSTGEHAIAFGFNFVIFINGALAYLITQVLGLQFPWRVNGGVFFASMLAGLIVALAGGGFTAITIPLVVGVCFPLYHVGYQVLSEIGWNNLTFSQRGLLVSSLFFVLHTMDYPWFRPIEALAPLGFTLAILCVFGLSVFAPAVVLEILARREARSQAELEVAHRIQMEILPKQPELDDLELACFMKPADEVGGDYYDIFRAGDFSWILLGDVTGHGLSSGLVMLMAQSIISSILHTRTDITPSELAYLANTILHKNLRRLSEDRHMTLVALCRHGQENRFVYSGSHDDLYVFRAATGEVEVVSVEEAPHGLGFLDDFEREEWTENTLALEKDDVLLLGTDGITEAAAGGEYDRGMFTEDRVIAFLKENARKPVDEIRERLVAELDRFTGGVFHDDVTFLVVRATA
ncbi:MAG: SpoIIE family protein phosphatase [Myxococcales bacterium]|nr:SpoIIE family protein phosphatase [Myxococcales bacterium]MCB9670086.1 SpoIIE family protein phosphatase [Alphaproteobacteria bacterium]